MYRIYYQNGKRHEDTDGPPVGEQARGVQTIIQGDPELGWAAVSGGDYFVWRNGKWWECDIAGLFDFLLDSGIVLFGRMIDRGEYSQIYSEALEDKALAEKTGFLPRRFKEPRP